MSRGALHPGPCLIYGGPFFQSVGRNSAPVHAQDATQGPKFARLIASTPPPAPSPSPRSPHAHGAQAGGAARPVAMKPQKQSVGRGRSQQPQPGPKRGPNRNIVYGVSQKHSRQYSHKPAPHPLTPSYYYIYLNIDIIIRGEVSIVIDILPRKKGNIARVAMGVEGGPTL